MVIIAAVGEKHSPKDIMETGYELAQKFGDEFQVLHVIPQDEAEEHFRGLRALPDMGDLSFDSQTDRAKEVARKMADAALGEYDGGMVQPIGRLGDPDEEILSQARDVDPRFLVIGGRKRSPTGKALFGSVTQKVILNAECPVVTVMASS